MTDIWVKALQALIGICVFFAFGAILFMVAEEVVIWREKRVRRKGP